MARFSILAVAWALSACAAPPPVAVNDCPPTKSYSAADQQSLKAAIDGLSPDSPLVGAILDYERLRDAARACAAP